MGFGDIIKQARKGRFSQQTLGKQIGVWGTYIGQIEKGERVPSDARCVQMAKALELDSRNLLIAAYRERAQEKEARALFRQMEKLLADPVTSRLVADRGLLDASLLEALERPKIRKALKDDRWRDALAEGVEMSDRDIPHLIQIIKQMGPQQWEALLNAAKAMAGIT
jgi:transcriptional regulator with XRE-family HTH domain